MLTKTYGHVTVKRIHHDRWVASYGDNAQYIQTSAESEEIATLRLIKKMGELLYDQGHRAIVHA